MESEDGLVKVELYNTHPEVKRYSLRLDNLPDNWIDQSERQVLLDTGERRTVFFYLTPREEGERTAEISVTSDGSTVFSRDVNVWTGGTTQSQQKGFLESLFDFF